jgi:hypothetical protein
LREKTCKVDGKMSYKTIIPKAKNGWTLIQRKLIYLN